jgi:hypothetical protein
MRGLQPDSLAMVEEVVVGVAVERAEVVAAVGGCVSYAVACRWPGA